MKKLLVIAALIVILGGCREPTFTQCLNDYHANANKYHLGNFLIPLHVIGITYIAPIEFENCRKIIR